jgi:hypothetical protein
MFFLHEEAHKDQSQLKPEGEQAGNISGLGGCVGGAFCVGLTRTVRLESRALSSINNSTRRISFIPVRNKNSYIH